MSLLRLEAPSWEANILRSELNLENKKKVLDGRLCSSLQTGADAFVTISVHEVIRAIGACKDRTINHPCIDLLGKSGATPPIPGLFDPSGQPVRGCPSASECQGSGGANNACAQDQRHGEYANGQPDAPPQHTDCAEMAHTSRIAAAGSLATTIAHELTQPLTAITNYIETSCDLLANPNAETLDMVRDAMRECAAQSARAGEIVRRMREFMSRGDAERRVESLSRVVEEAWELALIGLDDRCVTIDLELDPRADRVLVDRIQIQQVLFNLIRNAIEAMSGGLAQRLRIASERRNGEVCVTVEDSGPGLAASVAERLFDPFVSTKLEGMGMGLSICRTIIAGHGGRIWAEAGEAGGAAFQFTIALADANGDC